ncbi:MAG: hypothetical protein ACKVRO_13130 [Micropepsaceae bacterium]
MRDRQTARILTESGTLKVELAFLAVSLLLAAILEALLAVPGVTQAGEKTQEVQTLVNLLKRIARDILVLGLQFYLATQLVRILIFMMTVGDLLSGHFNTLKNVSLSNEIHNSLTQTVLKIFEHSDDYMRASVVAALDKFLETIKIERLRIELKSDYIAAEVYVSFWRELLKKQNGGRGKGATQPIQVRVCHSASLGIWESGDLLASTQADFCESGGQVCRILVRNEHSTDDLKDYDRVARRMTDIGIKTFFFDAHARGEAVHDDFLMCRVDDDFYVLVWNADWSATPRFGDINGCTLLVGQENYAIYKNKWNTLLNSLRDTTQTPPDEFSHLHAKPTEGELAKLRIGAVQPQGAPLAS